MRRRVLSALAAALLVSGATLRAEEKTAPRDPQSGLPTGKRMHKPYVFSASDRKLSLADGRTFVVNAQTGEVVFGDGAQGRRPETGQVPKDGVYRLGAGASGNVEIRGGRLVTLPATPVPAPVKAKAR